MSICFLLSAVGAVTLAVIVIKVFSFIKTNYFTTCDLKRRYGKAGNWAVVTGASEGIGYSMAMDLGRRGFNVCVIARTKSKLDDAVEELKRLGVEGMAISFDFSAATEQSWRELFAQLDKIEIAVLVNNVGISYDHTNYFEEVSIETDMRLLKVNCEAPLQMTKYVMPKMKAKRSGAIVMLGSASAVSPTPLLATYAGTKAFSLSFGTSLMYEVKKFGIDVLAVSPNMVVSKMTQGRSQRKPRETFFMVNADQMAHQTLDKLGAVPQTAGHRNHAIIERIFLLLPLDYRSNLVLKQLLGVKRRAEAKKPSTKE